MARSHVYDSTRGLTAVTLFLLLESTHPSGSRRRTSGGTKYIQATQVDFPRRVAVATARCHALQSVLYSRGRGRNVRYHHASVGDKFTGRLATF